MRLLLDTHAFLWWIMDDDRLSANGRKLIEDGGNEVFVSAASAWEIAVKCQLGKLTLPAKPDQFVVEHISANSFNALPIGLMHALSVYDLPPLHRDPFDRMLVCQARLERLHILSQDGLVRQYGVDAVW